MKRILSVLLVLIILCSGLTGCKEEEKPEVKPKYAPKNYSDVKDLKILAVGNSYFMSSQVMEYFQRLLYINDRTDVTVDHIAQGMYQVSFYYKDIFVTKMASNEYDKLRNGEYDILVLSTIYTHEDTPAVGDFLEALKDTKTDIILFPAANELTEAVTNAVGQYYVTCAHWQNYLSRLTFRHGFKGQHLGTDHTYEVGGFAGACLLYARLFNEVPDPGSLKNEMLSQLYDCFPGASIEEKGKAFDKIVNDSLEAIKDSDELFSTYK